MPLSADTLLDRLALKRQITRWRLLALATLLVAGLVLFEGKAGHSPIERAYIARLTLDDVIMDDMQRDELMADIRDNDKIKALVVRLDTPGGSAVAGMEVYNQLREIAGAKPVVAVMRDLSASAGYLIAVGADRIFAREGTLTGSIGVIIQATEFSELAQKIGVTPITIKTGPLKDALSPYNKATPEAMAAMQSVVNDFYQVFVDTVAKQRHLTHDEVVRLADGRVFTGRQAVANKLVDAIGSEKEAVAWMEAEKKLPRGLEVKDIKVKKEEIPFISHLAGAIMQKISPQSAAGLDGLVAIWHPNLQIQ